MAVRSIVVVMKSWTALVTLASSSGERAGADLWRILMRSWERKDSTESMIGFLKRAGPPGRVGDGADRLGRDMEGNDEIESSLRSAGLVIECNAQHSTLNAQRSTLNFEVGNPGLWG